MKYNITIRGAIGGWWGVQPDQISSYLNKHKEEKVDIAICSPGGLVDDGLEIYQAFKDHGNVHAHIIGMTASAATIIAMGAKTCDMVKNSIILIHNASTSILEWRSANKEQLDEIINKYKKEREDLKTIDDLIASIYADKTGRTLDDCKKKMTEGKWLSSADAKNFGLVDAIREDDKADKILDDIKRQYTNSFIQDFGLPAFPSAEQGQSALIAQPEVADENGNPTKGFIQKTWDALRDLVSNNHASKNNSDSMNKVFACICALLGYKSLESQDNAISLSVDDVQKVEDHIKELDKKVKDEEKAKDEANAKVTDLQKQLDDAKASISEKETEIANLKKNPAAHTTGIPEDEEEAVNFEENRKLFNMVMGKD